MNVKTNARVLLMSDIGHGSFLPFAACVLVTDEVLTVFVDGVVGEMHAHVFLKRQETSETRQTYADLSDESKRNTFLKRKLRKALWLRGIKTCKANYNVCTDGCGSVHEISRLDPLTHHVVVCRLVVPCGAEASQPLLEHEDAERVT